MHRASRLSLQTGLCATSISSLEQSQRVLFVHGRLHRERLAGVSFSHRNPLVPSFRASSWLIDDKSRAVPSAREAKQTSFRLVAMKHVGDYKINKLCIAVSHQHPWCCSVPSMSPRLHNGMNGEITTTAVKPAAFAPQMCTEKINGVA